MPGFDGTGPNGLGPMTGREMGNCLQAQGGCGRGLGRGRGFGRGRNCWVAAEAAPSQERIESLKACKKRIEAEIETLEKTAK